MAELARLEGPMHLAEIKLASAQDRVRELKAEQDRLTVALERLRGERK